MHHDTPPELVAVPQTINTERLTIRPWEPADAPALLASVDGARASLGPWLPWVAESTTLDHFRIAIQKFQSKWAVHSDLAVGIFDRTSGEVLGGSGLHRIDWELRVFEIGYWLGAGAEGHGYMTECAAALTLMAFEALDAERVEIRMDGQNRRSMAVPQRLGFVHEGTLRRSELTPDGEIRDTEVFALIRGDELPSRAAAGNPEWR
ncbi:MAG: GCN5-related N-acetyltransferase [Thermoleophilia bacterium]|nr:GCN5-related N-acetyltransferase [Thermoleophilia bacterium]